MLDGAQRLWSCLPVTALRHISFGRESLLCAGQGSTFKVWKLSKQSEKRAALDHRIVVHEQVFAFQSIHGIRARAIADCGSNLHQAEILILIWGGQSVALARYASVDVAVEYLKYQQPNLTVSSECRLNEWIFDAVFASSPSTCQDIAYLVTAKNNVLVLQRGPAGSQALRATTIASGPNSTLYSAQIKVIDPDCILIAAGTVFGEVSLWQCCRVDDRTGIKSKAWKSHIFKVIRAHNGSTFGVCLSNNAQSGSQNDAHHLLISCSDDRTIRLWDVSDCYRKSQPDSQNLGKLIGPALLRLTDNTAVAPNATTSLAITWAHQSRIWGVNFLDRDCTPDSSVLVSTGEDATCQIWKLGRRNPSSQEFDSARVDGMTLSLIGSDCLHSGKHIWSLAYRWDENITRIYTGGSDGAIVLRTLQPSRSQSGFFRSQVSLPSNVQELEIRNTIHQPSQRHQGKEFIKYYAFIMPDLLLTSTSFGRILAGRTGQDKHDDGKIHIRWSYLPCPPEHPIFLIMANDPDRQCVYLGGTEGQLCVYRPIKIEIKILTQLHRTISNIFVAPARIQKNQQYVIRHLLVCYSHTSVATFFQVAEPLTEQEIFRVIRSLELQLPLTFQPTAFLDLCSGRQIVLGSRSGALALYSSDSGFNHYETVTCVRHVHRSDTISCLQFLGCHEPIVGTMWHDILSTGKDGSYSIHRVCTQDCQRATLSTLHRSHPPFGPCIEGSAMVANAAGRYEVILYGFRSKDFILWNESSHQEMMSVFCGGAHRSWILALNGTSAISRNTEWSGYFVWTKAATVNIVKFRSDSRTTVQEGGHGREIKAMALNHGPLSAGLRNASTGQLIATGAEDTMIRIWSLQALAKGNISQRLSPPHNDVSPMLVLKKHTTGLQHLIFCNNYLFSSSGFEELFIWKLNLGVSGVGVGVILEAAMPKHEPISDLRITSFDVYSGTKKYGVKSSLGDPHHFQVFVAYSNSMVRVFQTAYRYSTNEPEKPTSRADLIAEGYYNTTCLTQLCLLPGEHSEFITASTNGAVALWLLAGEAEQSTSSPSLSCIADFFIHQNAILTMQILPLPVNHQKDRCQIILTGGDDNAVGIGILYRCSGQNSTKPPESGTLLLSQAHTAAVTALEVIDTTSNLRESTFLLATTSQDQLIKVWCVRVELGSLSRHAHAKAAADLADHNDIKSFEAALASNVDVQLLKQMWTNVADASSIISIPLRNSHNVQQKDEQRVPGGVIGYRDARVEATVMNPTNVTAAHKSAYRVMVAGIGMEIVEIDVGYWK